jgi:hypothetical protein
MGDDDTLLGKCCNRRANRGAIGIVEVEAVLAQGAHDPVRRLDVRLAQQIADNRLADLVFHS